MIFLFFTRSHRVLERLEIEKISYYLWRKIVAFALSCTLCYRHRISEFSSNSIKQQPLHFSHSNKCNRYSMPVPDAKICTWILWTQTLHIIQQETKPDLSFLCKLQFSACFSLKKFNCALTRQHSVFWRKEYYTLKMLPSLTPALFTHIEIS